MEGARRPLKDEWGGLPIEHRQHFSSKEVWQCRTDSSGNDLVTEGEFRRSVLKVSPGCDVRRSHLRSCQWGITIHTLTRSNGRSPNGGLFCWAVNLRSDHCKPSPIELLRFDEQLLWSFIEVFKKCRAVPSFTRRLKGSIPVAAHLFTNPFESSLKSGEWCC